MGKVDPRTDIYSLGVVFFQMVTGRLPFTADTPAAVLLKHVQDPLPRPGGLVPGLPEAVEQVIYKALAKEPDQRFQTMEVFANALLKLAQGDLVHLEPESTGAETLLAGSTVSSAAAIKEAIPASTGIAPVWKKMVSGKTGLIIAGGVVGVVLLVAFLAGGIWLASRLGSRAKDGANLPAVTEITPTPAALPSPTEIQTGQTEASGSPVGSTGVPFTSIAGLPEDIPIIKDNNGNLSTSKSQGMTMYYFTTSMAYQQVADFYKTGMASNGWTIQNETTQADTTYWVFMKGDNRQVMIGVMQLSGEAVQVSIILYQ